MATARVSKLRSLNFLCVATSEGISLTQVTQVVAQKLTRVTLPLRSAVLRVLPSSSTKVESGAASRVLQPAIDRPMAASGRAASVATARRRSGRGVVGEVGDMAGLGSAKIR